MVAVSCNKVSCMLRNNFVTRKMVDEPSVVEHAHKIQALAKDLEYYYKYDSYVSSYKFLAGGHYAKLSPSWRGFSTTIKHEASVIVNLIVALVVEEMARTKDTYEKGFLGLPVPICKKNNSNAFQNNNKKKNPLQNQTMSNKTTTFKNKRKGNC